MSEPMDEEYLTEWARERQQRAVNYETRGGDRCTTACGHRWHGSLCTTEGCGCPSSWRATA